MEARELETILLDELGYRESSGFRTNQEIIWPHGRPISNISAAYFLNDTTPVAYFSRFSDLNEAEIRRLHRDVWSQSKAPLLFVTLPHEIRIYNGYAIPPQTDEALDTPERLLRTLDSLTDQLTAQQKITEQLVDENHYERIYIETGAFWDSLEGQRFHQSTRADQRLIKSMQKMRELLREKGLSNHIAYTLLGRSVFIRYLEDRDVLDVGWMNTLTDNNASSYQEALQDRTITYQLFERISEHFNGDLFPIEPEEEDVQQTHIDLLARFLKGDDMETGQLSLFPYNFEFIPIELISNIYDTFIEKDTRRKSGSYYTPLPLVDFILEETMGSDVIEPEMTVLDPACGSGVFLVGAYRRLIAAWNRRYNRRPLASDLKTILEQCIFGVDKNDEAVRIAAFSLYLEILNHLTNNEIKADFKFPSIQNQTLLKCDFFDTETIHFSPRSFDRIVGNLPWGKGTLTAEANTWLKAHGLTVGGQQAAPAFMLRVPEFCKEEGELALLTPTKSTILVTSKPHQKFRKQFFDKFHVRAIVNFSAIRHELFEGTISPTIAAFYTPCAPRPEEKLIYATPKPSPLSHRLRAILLDTTEIKFLDLAELRNKPYLWKVALWGSARDLAFIDKLKQHSTLIEVANERNWEMDEGIQINGGDENPAPWLEDIDWVPTDKLRPYLPDKSVFEKIDDTLFHRPRTERLVKGPLVLIRQSKSTATFSSQSLAFRHKISGISGVGGQEDLLKWLVAYLNSNLAKYYHFHTSTSWAVEQGTIIHGEYEQMPFFIPQTDSDVFSNLLVEVEQLFDEISNEKLFSQSEQKIESLEAEINKMILDIFKISHLERTLISDTLEYGVGFFNWAKKKRRKPLGAKAVKEPNEEMLTEYSAAFTTVIDSLLKYRGQTLNATVYKNGAPLAVVTFEFVDESDKQPAQLISTSQALRNRLRELDTLARERKTPSLYMQRHVRVYDGNTVSLIRPNQQRFWTQSQARVDADDFIAEMLDHFEK